ncbi:YidB family protein, partial [Rubellimicrobium roseum]
ALLIGREPAAYPSLSSVRVCNGAGTGQNREVEPQDLEAALGPDVLEDLTEATGLSREELLQRLSRELPRAVDQYTPQGRIPQPHEFG